MRGAIHLLMSVLLIATTLHAPRALGATDGAEPDLEWLAAHGADAAASGGRCSTFDFGPEALPRSPGKDRGVTLDAAAPITIPVAFHVISKEVIKSGVRSKVGDVSTSKLDAQINVLNSAFASASIRFTKISVDRVTNNAWFEMTMGSSAELTAKRALAIDPAKVLNVYVCGIPNGTLGWAYYPWSFTDANAMHGLVLLYTTLPGGSRAPYNKGDTAVHEIGHYLALYHTFQSGCSSSGDLVADTPSEASPAYSCTSGRDTCPAPGLDPIHNYMDYGDDECMTGFTNGQMSRMRWAMSAYKRNLGGYTTQAAPAPAPGASGSPGPIVTVSPNPFNPTTSIEFDLEREAYVSLRVFDVRGREVARLLEGVRGAGTHRVRFDGDGLASGVYHAILESGGSRARQRLVLLK